MNRFVAFTVFALAAIAVANSAPQAEEFPGETETQAALTTTPEEETAPLKALKLEVFAPYCIDMRDMIYRDVRSKIGTASSKGFSWFFSMADDIAQEAMRVNQDATSRLGNQLANPEAAVAGDDQVAAAQREVAEQSQPKALITAFTAALSATAEAVINVMTEKIAQVKEFSDPRVSLNILSISTFGCDTVRDYEHKMRNMFDSFKESLPAEAGMQGVRYENIPCVTIRRVSRVDGLCGLISNSYTPFMKLWRGHSGVNQSAQKQLAIADTN